MIVKVKYARPRVLAKARAMYSGVWMCKGDPNAVLANDNIITTLSPAEGQITHEADNIIRSSCITDLTEILVDEETLTRTADQLRDLIRDRESFADSHGLESPFNADIKALEIAVRLTEFRITKAARDLNSELSECPNCERYINRFVTYGSAMRPRFCMFCGQALRSE